MSSRVQDFIDKMNERRGRGDGDGDGESEDDGPRRGGGVFGGQTWERSRQKDRLGGYVPGSGLS
jgi:hypothetical protein